MEQTKEAIQLSSLSMPELDKVLKTYPWFSLARKEFFLRMSFLGDEYRVEGLKKAAVYVFSREGLLKDGQKIAEAAVLKPVSSEADVSEDFDLASLETDFDKEEEIRDFAIDPIDPKHLELTPKHVIETAVAVAPEAPITEKSPKEETLEMEEAPIEIERQEIVRPTKEVVRIIGGDYFGKEDFASLKEDGMTTLERLRTISSTGDFSEIEVPEDEDDFRDEYYYTETLAKIYAGQGFYQRALEVYEKLILLYPEKSTYFAALKEETKKHL